MPPEAAPDAGYGAAGARPHAVLWDMDGTLIDTEPYWLAEEHELVGRYGGTWTAEHAKALVGNDLMVSARFIREHGQVPLEPEEIVDVLVTGVAARLGAQVPWRPGALDLRRLQRRPERLSPLSHRAASDPVHPKGGCGLLEEVPDHRQRPRARARALRLVPHTRNLR